MITMTTSSSSRVKPPNLRLLSRMVPPDLSLMGGLMRVHVGPQVLGLVLAARGIGDDHRRAQQHLARRGEARPGPVVVAELEEVLVARRDVPEDAAVLEDLRAVLPYLQEAVAVRVQLELEHEVGPASERDGQMRGPDRYGVSVARARAA